MPQQAEYFIFLDGKGQRVDRLEGAELFCEVLKLNRILSLFINYYSLTLLLIKKGTSLSSVIS